MGARTRRRRQGYSAFGAARDGHHVAPRTKYAVCRPRHRLVPQCLRGGVMRGLILAAGRGSRMGTLGDDRPKCMVELDGRPLLDRQIAALRRGGVNEIGIVRGYRAEVLNFPGLVYFDNPRWAQTNMVMSLTAAASWLRTGPVIVSYADIFYRGDVVHALAQQPGALVISF